MIQVDGTAPAADIRLSEADLAEIDAIQSDAMPVWGPGGHSRPRWCTTAGLLDDNLRYLFTREELRSAARVGRNLQDTEVVVHGQSSESAR